MKDNDKKKTIKPIFSRNEDFRKIAFLNWRMDSSEIRSLLNLADGYFMSGLELTKQCLIDNSHNRADILIFPILTNINHGIELYLKGILWMLNILLKNEREIEGRHNIDQIYKNVKAKIKEYEGHKVTHDFESDTFGLSEYIIELYDKINASFKNDKMDFSRYTFSKNRESHFYVDGFTNVEIDLENFLDRFNEIWRKLEAISDYYFYNKILIKENYL